jgi:hypothetical protein
VPEVTTSGVETAVSCASLEDLKILVGVKLFAVAERPEVEVRKLAVSLDMSKAEPVAGELASYVRTRPPLYLCVSGV